MMDYSTVADLTVDEFKSLIREVVTQTMVDLLNDPDEGLELREEIKERLERSLVTSQTNGKTRSAQELADIFEISFQQVVTSQAQEKEKQPLP
jgi:hypothetical protein